MSNDAKLSGDADIAGEAAAKTGRRGVQALSAVVFCSLALALVVFLSFLMTPPFKQDVNYSVGGIYSQPRDSVQVAVIGASTLYRAVSPDELYEKYGIAAYNCGSANQPYIASYYLLKEMIRKHGSTLNTVVLDATGLVKNNSAKVQMNNALKVFSRMEMSEVKLEFLQSMSQEYEDIDFIEMLVPLFKYHSRWNELTAEDYSSKFSGSAVSYSHGQIVNEDSFISNASNGRAGLITTEKNETITADIDSGEEEMAAALNEDSVRYFEKIKALCDQHNLNLLIFKTPASYWDDLRHDSVVSVAKSAGVEFLDMSFSEVQAECGLSYDADFRDSRHVNLTASLKVSDYLGEYLVETFGISSSPEQVAPSFTDEDLREYDQVIEDAKLLSYATLEDYLGGLDRDRLTVFIATNGNAASEMSSEARDRFRDMGMEKLSQLSENETYVGIYEGGKCIREKVGENGAEASIKGSYADFHVTLANTSMQSGASLETPLELSSVRKKETASAMISIGGKDLCENKQGVNFVVYDRKIGWLVDTSSFDTLADSKRTSDLPIPII